MRREHRALSRLALGSGIEGIPRVLDFDAGRLTRSWIDGAPMQIAQAARPRLLPRRRCACCAACTPPTSSTTISPRKPTGW